MLKFRRKFRHLKVNVHIWTWHLSWVSERTVFEQRHRLWWSYRLVTQPGWMSVFFQLSRRIPSTRQCISTPRSRALLDKFYFPSYCPVPLYSNPLFSWSELCIHSLTTCLQPAAFRTSALHTTDLNSQCTAIFKILLKIITNWTASLLSKNVKFDTR